MVIPGVTAEDRQAVLDWAQKRKRQLYRRRPRVLSIGTISARTLRLEDLIPAFVSVLEDLRLSRAHRQELQAIARRAAADEDSDYWGDEAPDDLDMLEQLAGEYAPDYCYVGSTDGDGAEIGVWPVSELLEDTHAGGFDGCIGRSTRKGEHPTDVGADTVDCTGQPYAYFLQVNDHGNATLYRRAGRRWIEVWSVV